MVYIIADNIISPLGDDSEQTYQQMLKGHSRLKRYDNLWHLREPVVASMFDKGQRESISIEGNTFFESIVISSIRKALASCAITLDGRTVLIISTTKGNIEHLDCNTDVSALERYYPGKSAEKIAKDIGITTQPIVCCNACISGVSAIILAMRLLNNGTYDKAIVTGAETLSEFIVSGFQSLKALSQKECRPFDMERTGLNLGEAAATMILSTTKQHDGNWEISKGAIRNDANHLSNPSKTAEGSYRAITKVLSDEDISSLSAINVHGTATLFNDQMESIAIKRANLSSIPTNALKGYLGHTMGASGVMEAILTMHSLDNNLLLGTRGYEERGVSGKINISDKVRELCNSSAFLKLISGFGGCNAALLIKKQETEQTKQDKKQTLFKPIDIEVTHRVIINNTGIIVDGINKDVNGTGKELLTNIYKSDIGDYPKFYKMDILSRLGFIASELLLKAEGRERFKECEDRAVALFNSSSSICADRAYHESIKDEDNYYPSPSAFIYTLPNIVTGEIAIRNKYYGETVFYVLPHRDDSQINEIINTTFMDTTIRSVIGGWIDCEDDSTFEADIFITERKQNKE